jgi:hypothetical protein
LELIERGNKRLAWALGADPRATDAARILRVAGTRNWKRGEPERVSITSLNIHPNVTSRALVAELPDPAPKEIPAPRSRRPNLGPDPDKDAILAVPARAYVEALCGREVLRNMVQCPFHGSGQERTPSLHVAGPQDTLWHCFGCDEGGDVFTFTAKLWGLDEVRDFPALKARLKEALR